jgi:predicted Fe-Mo cluster-binding NifX family protein
MSNKVLITIEGDHIAPRFDLTTEVLIATMSARGHREAERTVVLPHASPEDLCHLILSKGIETLICNGIEDEYYQYLKWKKVEVYDSVIGPWSQALIQYRRGKLKPQTIFFDPKERVKR